ncbi:MAG: carboxypeptidase regulatory-like domain-containing protein [Acidobacteria bacterium]|nr:carboxypeptidase regulatory-like domain-containing protein [Acidobacteriota bacterium]
MRRSILLFIAVLLAGSVFGQTVRSGVEVNESDTRVALVDTLANVKLALDNPGSELSAIVKLEILTPDDHVAGKTENVQRIGSGRQIVSAAISIDETARDDPALLWYRLRYEIAPETGPKTTGIVSLSRVLPEVFEVTAFTNFAFGEQIFRARVLATSPATDEPVAGVAISAEIKIENREEPLKAQSITDSQGSATLEFDLPTFGEYDDLDLTVAGSKGGLTRNVSVDLRGSSLRYASISTDKPIYQPAQTVNMRLYHYIPNLKPVDGGVVTIEISNSSEDETAFSQRVTTSRFGLASVSWKIPDGVRLGDYEINVRDLDDNTIASVRIKITRYDLPAFFVEAKPDRKFYLPDQPLSRIAINAQYLFGKPVPAGTVRIVAPRQDEFQEIRGELDVEGKFSTEIDLTESLDDLAKNLNKRFDDLRFTAIVTDASTNRSESRAFEVRVSREPIHVYLGGSTWNRSSRLPLDYYVTTFYPDGTPASCEVGVFRRVESDLDGNKMATELGDILAKTRTNKYGVARLKLPATPSDSEDLELKIVAYDANRVSGSLEEDIDIDDRPAVTVETDKIAYRKGEPIRVSVKSSERRGLVFLDVTDDYRLLYSTQVKLDAGQATLVLPYSPEFTKNLTVAAYFWEEDDNLIIGRREIIYPTPIYLNIDADTGKSTFRPGEDVSVRFRARRDGVKEGRETALGVLVLDRAVEERARTESELDDNPFLNRSFTSGIEDLLGTQKMFGGFAKRDISNLDLKKPLEPDFELALEAGLANDRYEPRIDRSRSFRDDLAKVFDYRMRQTIRPVADALEQTDIFEKTQPFPTDENRLRQFLRSQNVDFSSLRDPWGNEFRTDFRVEREYLTLDIWSLGPDKTSGTNDDLSLSRSNWRYFTPVGRAIDAAMREYTGSTNGFITDLPTLTAEMKGRGLDLETLRDPFGRPYRFDFYVERTNYVLAVRSDGPDGNPGIAGVLPNDDFVVWTNRSDYFLATKANLIKGFNKYVAQSKTFPLNEGEMNNALAKSGFDLAGVKDAFGRPYYVRQKSSSRLANVYRFESKKLTVVKQKILMFAVRSAGMDGIQGNFDDFDLASFSGAISEEDLNRSTLSQVASKIDRQKLAGSRFGALGGTVFDANGAVIPGSTITVTANADKSKRQVTGNAEGEFLVPDLTPGQYELRVESSYFKALVIMNISIEAGALTEIDAGLEVGDVTTTVEVTALADVVNTTDASISNSVNAVKTGPRESRAASIFTPRVRDYFAETLVWSPELVTDKSGRAELKFKMADSLTTWKMYVVGSDTSGAFGVVEKELMTFQPFFVELEPPRVLTEGDEIALPVPVRNYTKGAKKVSVALAPNDWSQALDGGSQKLEIPSNSTRSGVFRFRASVPVVDGKQKVTALAGKDGDAVEKPVTVRPNGKEIVESKSSLFQKETSFDLEFPANSFPATRRAEIKLYPNMFAHVAESVDGLLKRPYGCGEQTTSSTYPNLLILRIEKELGREIDPRIRNQAKVFLDEGYKRLLNYQTDTGFGYWNGGEPDVALTAYVLRFLSEAGAFLDVDEQRVEKAEKWLLARQGEDGSWESKRREKSATTAYVLRSLTKTARDDEPIRLAVKRGAAFLLRTLNETKDGYLVANLALAAQALGDEQTAAAALGRLEMLAIPESGGVYWTTSQTPFGGWGTAANIETTALALQAFTNMKSGEESARFENLKSGAVLFLLRSKDRYGVWHSTQTTVNVLDALVLFESAVSRPANKVDRKAEIFVNGRRLAEVPLAGATLAKPLVVVATKFLVGERNRIEIRSETSEFLLAQTVATHFVDWEAAPSDNRFFDFDVEFDKLNGKIGEEIVCRVNAASRFRYWGMAIAEVGLPPGAEVDRAGLVRARNAGALSSFDILPDRVVIYFWPEKPLNMAFSFRPRFGLNAQSAPSVVYDYYNEEAKGVVAPKRFRFE